MEDPCFDAINGKQIGTATCDQCRFKSSVAELKLDCIVCVGAHIAFNLSAVWVLNVSGQVRREVFCLSLLSEGSCSR
jgi:hypothetical protein